jgi:mannose-6-phosphate isomerase-like protein (cupin superfamily)
LQYQNSNYKKPNGVRNTAYAINLVRNEGMTNVDLNSKWITTPDKCNFTKIEKPWGSEELLEVNDKYVVKKLCMNKGHSCSLQYHKLKTETITVLSGYLSIYIGDSIDNIQKQVLTFGESITIKPYTIHRMSAEDDDCVYIESSTNELWDVVRLQDDYLRI